MGFKPDPPPPLHNSLLTRFMASRVWLTEPRHHCHYPYSPRARFYSALLDFVCSASVMAQASVVRPSVKSGFSETTAWTLAKFYGKPPIRHIPKLLFSFQIFTIFYFPLTWGHMEVNFSKCYFSNSFSQISNLREMC